MTMQDYIITVPGIIAGLIGFVLFLMTIRSRWLISATALVAAIAECLFYFYFILEDTSSTFSRLPRLVEGLISMLGFFGGPVFLFCATLLIAFSKDLRWKRGLLTASIIGTIIAFTHSAYVLKLLSEIP